MTREVESTRAHPGRYLASFNTEREHAPRWGRFVAGQLVSAS